ncbi:MAG: hypothetical protein SA339_11000 [Methanomassiliicoccus sp.]|nr:hypothetical protein [Methanomassiliicoccus sp.]
MRRRNAILAAVIAIAIVAAAAGGIMLMNPGSNTANVGNEGSNNGMPNSTGTVRGVEVISASVNRSNASPLTELRAELNATPLSSGTPDFLMKVAVTNNGTQNLTLNGTGFVAMLSDNTTATALNNMSMTVEPNQTVFPILGFQTNGSSVQSVSYSSGSLSFNVEMTPQRNISLPAMVTTEAPSINPTTMKNLTITDLATWQIGQGGDSPINLMFGNGSMVLALMTVTNNNTTSMSLQASDFWLDVGNGTWVQGDMGLNNNLPSRIANNTTVPFLIGFRIAENMTVNGSVYFWPGQGSLVSQIPLTMTSMSNATPALALKSIWDPNGTMGGNWTDRLSGAGIKNLTSDNGTIGSSLMNATQNLTIELALLDNASASNISNMMVWTEKNGSMSVTPTMGADNNTINVTVALRSGDDLTLMSYTMGNETRYIWMRSLGLQA